MGGSRLLVFLVLGLVGYGALCLADTMTETTVVLVGATSSLAKKYLWQSFFKAYLEDEAIPNHGLQFYGGATRPAAEGERLLQEILASSTTCKGVTTTNPQACEEKLADYRSRVQYVQLRNPGQYGELQARIQTHVMEEGMKEDGRLYYLAISPDLYPSAAEGIDTLARPGQDAWLRVVLEKPFGRDLESALALVTTLEKHLKEEEIFRVDHYMGKTAVQGILPFRHSNKHWLENLWNNKYVENVEVAMKETEDCEGRTGFYEGYGVIRDVLQNHLTEILALLKMDLPHDDPDNVFGGGHHRTAVLKQLRLHPSENTVFGSSVLVGQYHGYDDHVASDKRLSQGDYDSHVPTAAVVTLTSENPRWKGVKFTLKAGKGLNERAAYARAYLRPPGATRAECHLLFNIQGGDLGTAIAYNRTACGGLFSEVKVPPGWTSYDQGNLHVLRPDDADPPNAYDVVVQEVLEGDRSMFLDTEELLVQWAAWDPVLKHADELKPKVYHRGFALDDADTNHLASGDDEVLDELERGVRTEL